MTTIETFCVFAKSWPVDAMSSNDLKKLNKNKKLINS